MSVRAARRAERRGGCRRRPPASASRRRTRAPWLRAVRAPSAGAWASIAATRAAFSRCWRGRPATKRLRCRGRPSQVAARAPRPRRRARRARASRCGEPLGEARRAARACARLLDDPAALVGGAAERRRARRCASSSDSAPSSDRERIALVRLLVERAARAARAAPRSRGAPRRAIRSCRLRERPLARRPRRAGRRVSRARPGRGRAPSRARRARASRCWRVPRASRAGAQGGRRCARSGGVGSERDRHGREQQREPSGRRRAAPHASSRRSPRGADRSNFAAAPVVVCAFVLPIPGVPFLAQLSVAAIRNGC